MICVTGIVKGVIAPILPSMLKHDWISKSQAGYIISIGSLGLLIGSALSPIIGKKLTLGLSARLFLLTAMVSVALCALNYGPLWLAMLRFVAGISIAIVVISVTSLITQGIAGSARGMMIAFIGFGTGLGIIVISTTLPMAFIDLNATPRYGWLYAASLIALCTIIAWPGLHSRPDIDEFPKHKQTHSEHRHRLILLIACYGLIMFATAPFVIYFPAYISHEFKIEPQSSSAYYAIVGLGMIGGGLICNYLFVRLFGRYLSLIITMGIGLCAAGTILLVDNLWINLMASYFMAITITGASGLKTYNILELAGPAAEAIWLRSFKIVTAIAFASGSFASGFLLALDLGYDTLFAMIACLYMLSLIISLFIKLPNPVEVHIHETAA